MNADKDEAEQKSFGLREQRDPSGAEEIKNLTEIFRLLFLYAGKHFA